MRLRTLPAIFGLSLLCVACSGNPEAPPEVPETIEEDFGGNLELQGVVPFEFSLGKAGAVSVTLASVVLARPGPTTTVAVSVGLGTPTEGVCNALTSVTTSAGLTSQLTATLDAGLRCVVVTDVGNLTVPVSFTMRVVHP